MKVIELNKKTNNKVDQLELAISVVCLVSGVTLSKTAIKVLAYYVVYGIKKATDDLLINSNIVNLTNLRNIKTKLIKLRFIKKTEGLYKSYELALSKDFVPEKELKLFIKIDNS